MAPRALLSLAVGIRPAEPCPDDPVADAANAHHRSLSESCGAAATDRARWAPISEAASSAASSSHRDQHEIERAIEDAWQAVAGWKQPRAPDSVLTTQLAIFGMSVASAQTGAYTERRHPGIAACSPEIAVYRQPRKSALTKESAQQSGIAGRIPSSMLARGESAGHVKK